MHPTDCSALELGEWVHNVAALFHFMGKELMLALVFQNPRLPTSPRYYQWQTYNSAALCAYFVFSVFLCSLEREG